MTTVNPDAVFDTTTKANASTLLPPLTAAIRQVWADATATTAAVGPAGKPAAMRQLLNAVYALELRVLTLEGTPFG